MITDIILPPGFTDTLLWSKELGRGFHTRPAMSYDGDYFAKYQEMDATPMGSALTKARCDFVHAHCDSDEVVDIGIGGGRFVEDFGCYGFDVSRAAQHWLLENDRWRNPYLVEVDAVTCWDSLEHIPEPEKLLAVVKRFLFVSMPIYADMQDALRSKHYKPGEHLHYWTHNGFVMWAVENGFRLLDCNVVESELGREGIYSYAFERVEPL